MAVLLTVLVNSAACGGVDGEGYSEGDGDTLKLIIMLVDFAYILANLLMT